MTLCVAVTTADGLVMGADSATYVRDASLQKTYFNADKIFEIPGLPIAIMTYGLGSLGRRSIGSLIEVWSDEQDFGENYTVEDVAKSVVDFVFDEHRRHRALIEEQLAELSRERLQAQQPEEVAKDLTPQISVEIPVFEDRDWSTGLIVGGYQPDSIFPWLWTFEEPQSDPSVVIGLHCQRPHQKERERDVGPESGVDFWGSTEPLRRLVYGYAPDVIQKLGVDDTTFRQIVEEFAWPIAYEGMPLKDAVDLAQFLLEVGCGYEKFAARRHTYSGGPVDIVVIDRRKGVHWERRKPLTEAIALKQGFKA